MPYRTIVILAALLALYSAGASAELQPYDPNSGEGVLDRVVSEFGARATAWQGVVMDAARRLFVALGAMSFAWTFGLMALRKADLGEFFAEFIRFIVFFGFFYWLLANGPAFADSIIASLRELGDSAAGTSDLSASGIVDVGFKVLDRVLDNLELSIDSLVGLLLGVGILILLTVIAVNLVLLLVAGWILMYAGLFFLGFGGSRWTSDMAINYYRTVLGLAVQLFVMTLLVGIGQDLLTAFYGRMSKGPLSAPELCVMLTVCLALMVLSNKVPALVAGVVAGGGAGHSGIGNVGAAAVAGAAAGAASMALAAASMGGSMMGRGAVETAGGWSALREAFASGEKNAAAAPPGPGADDTPKLPDAGKTGGGKPAGKGGGSGTQVLMQGARAVLGQKAESLGKQWNDAVAGSFGGKVAAAIKESRKPADSDKEKDAGGPGGKAQDAGQGASTGPQQAEPAFSADGLGAGRETPADGGSGQDTGAASASPPAGSGTGGARDSEQGTASRTPGTAAGTGKPAGGGDRQATAEPSAAAPARNQAKDQDTGQGTENRQPFSLWTEGEFGSPGPGDWEAVIAEFARPRE